MDTIQTEVLVVGSGFGAAAPALRLSTAGFQVLMIEKGPDIVPERDFEQTQDPQYLLRYIKSIRGDNVSFTYAEGLGGGSGFYEMVSLRAPSMAFEQKGQDGVRLWPAGLTRTAMDPYYKLAETMMHVCQIGKDEIPKSGLALSYLLSGLGYSVDRVPYSVQGCLGHSYCVAGCIAGAKVTLHHTYLEPAVKAGMTIMTGWEAREIHRLEIQGEGEHSNRNIQCLPYRYEVRCFNSATNTSMAAGTRHAPGNKHRDQWNSEVVGDSSGELSRGRHVYGPIASRNHQLRIPGVTGHHHFNGKTSTGGRSFVRESCLRRGDTFAGDVGPGEG
jgi:choline dehydrogenase-like flavoprotein